MKFSNELMALGLALLAAPGADAFWRMECRGVSAIARIDPLVNPGAKSSHAHTIAGGSGKSPTVSNSYLRGEAVSSNASQQLGGFNVIGRDATPGWNACSASSAQNHPETSRSTCSFENN